MERITSCTCFKSLESIPINLSEFLFKIERLSSGPLFGKLTASNLPTLAPDGAQTLPRNFSSVVISTSIVLLPRLLYRTLPEIAVIFDNLF